MGVLNTYIPEKGDIIWLSFSPQSGHEQAGRRPAVVLSPKIYNKNGLALVCPITSRPKGYRFEVPLPLDLPIHVVILSNHVKNLDWKSREASYICSVSDTILQQVILRIKVLLDAP